MKDSFIAAKEYGDEKISLKRKNSRGKIIGWSFVGNIEGDRIVHIHSYRQDEILMFGLAQEFGLL